MDDPDKPGHDGWSGSHENPDIPRFQARMAIFCGGGVPCYHAVMTLALLDHAFTALHLLLVGFNLFGWIPRATRRLHRWCAGLTALCWLGAGMIVGTIGYCPLTDWHWRVKRLRGEDELPHSFITWLLNRAGLTPDPALVDTAVGLTFAAIVAIAAALWLRERRETTRRN